MNKPKFMKCVALLSLSMVALMFLVYGNCFGQIKSNELIWKGKPYASFTSLEHYKGSFYGAFREGKSHYDVNGNDNGSITIIKSSNGKKWSKFLSYSEDCYDLRDPKLSITPDGKLMLLVEKVKYAAGEAKERKTCVSFIDKKGNHTGLNPIQITPDMSWNWLWDVTWIDGTAYGFTYAPYYAFVKSNDGINYEVIERPELNGLPTETGIAECNEGLMAIARKNQNSALGIYTKSKKQWQWDTMDFELSCPKIISAENGKIYVAGRSYSKSKVLVSLYSFNIKDKTFQKIADLSEGLDCAYPGLAYYKGNLYVSYYKGDGESSSIYFSRIKVD